MKTKHFSKLRTKINKKKRDLLNQLNIKITYVVTAHIRVWVKFKKKKTNDEDEKHGFFLIYDCAKIDAN